jgi:hypothetical protein
VKAASSPVSMKKITITILLALPILLSAAPVFAALSTTPASSDNFNALQITVTSNDNRRVILVDYAGIVVGDTETSHGYPYPYADGTYSPSQLGFISNGYGTYTIISTLQSENGHGSCTPGNTIMNCIGMINYGSGYYNESTFNLFAPPPPVTIGPGVLVLPSTDAPDLLASVSNVMADAGFLGIIILAMAIPLFFWFAREIVALNRHNQKRK